MPGCTCGHGSAPPTAGVIPSTVYSILIAPKRVRKVHSLLLSVSHCPALRQHGAPAGSVLQLGPSRAPGTTKRPLPPCLLCIGPSVGFTPFPGPHKPTQLATDPIIRARLLYAFRRVQQSRTLHAPSSRPHRATVLARAAALFDAATFGTHHFGLVGGERAGVCYAAGLAALGRWGRTCGRAAARWCASRHLPAGDATVASRACGWFHLRLLGWRAGGVPGLRCRLCGPPSCSRGGCCTRQRQRQRQLQRAVRQSSRVCAPG